MKKIAVPTRGNAVDDHFGHCEFYTIFTLDEGKNVVSSEIMPSPQGCGCKSNVASIFQEMGVTLMLAGNMGPGALNVLTSHGVSVIRGCSGDVRAVLDAYLRGELADSGVGCAGHGEGHHCPEHGA